MKATPLSGPTVIDLRPHGSPPPRPAGTPSRAGGPSGSSGHNAMPLSPPQLPRPTHIPSPASSVSSVPASASASVTGMSAGHHGQVPSAGGDGAAYHAWVEGQFAAYRSDIAAQKAHITDLEQQLVAAGGAKAAAEQASSRGREEDRKTIDKLERLVERFRSEGQVVISDHMKLQDRQQETAGQHEKLKRRIMQLDVELRTAVDNAARDKEQLEGMLQAERDRHRGVAEELQKATQKLSAEASRKGDADRAVGKAEQQAAAATAAADEGRAKIDQLQATVRELRDQVRFLNAAVEEQKRAAAREVDAALQSADRTSAAAEAQHRAAEAAAAELRRVMAQLEHERGVASEAEASLQRALDDARAQIEAGLGQHQALQQGHAADRERAQAEIDAIAAQRDALRQQLLATQQRDQDRAGEGAALSAQISALKAQIADEQNARQQLAAEAQRLQDLLQGAEETAAALASRLAAAEDLVNRSAAEGDATSDRLAAAHREVTRLQTALAEAHAEGEELRTALGTFENDAADAQQRLGQRQQAVDAAEARSRDLRERIEQQAAQLVDAAATKALLEERIEGLEHRLREARAEIEKRDCEAAKNARDRQKQQLAHASALEEQRNAHEQALSDAAMAAARRLQEVQFEEQQRRQQAVAELRAAMEQDPRVRRVAEAERIILELQAQLSERAEGHATTLAEKERAIKSAHAALAAKEREAAMASADRDEAKARVIGLEEERADIARQLHALRSAATLATASSEAQARDAVARSAMLVLQKLHADYITAARHREELFGLKDALRRAADTAEAAHEDAREQRSRADALQAALDHETAVSRELTAKLAGRSQYFSPQRGAAAIRGTLSQLAIEAEASNVDDATAAETAFIRATRWDLVSALCKQELRCEAALEEATAAHDAWVELTAALNGPAPSRSLHHHHHDPSGSVQTPHASRSDPAPQASNVTNSGLTTALCAELGDSVAALVDLARAASNAQQAIARSFYTDSEKSALSQSRTAAA